MCSSKEGSVKELQELAAQIFVRDKIEAQATIAEADSKKKQPNKELNSNANMSPLARFLLSRLVGKTAPIGFICFPFIYYYHKSVCLKISQDSNHPPQFLLN